MTVGARVEGRWYPSDGADVLLPSGPTSRRLPVDWGISPRIGWTYSGDDWYAYGGAGEFRGDLPLAPLASLLGDDGSTRRDLLCLGADVPSPDWALYRRSPGAAPGACAGGTPGSTGVAPLTVFAPGLRAFFATSARPENLPFRQLLFENGFQRPDGIESDLGTAIGKLRQNP